MEEHKEDLTGQSKENAGYLGKEIDRLEAGYWDNLKFDYNAFWERAKQISAAFKERKPLSKEDRERLWGKFDNICKETKRRQNQEWSTRRLQSKNKKELIETRIREASNYIGGAYNNEHLSKSKSLLNEALEIMKDGWSGRSALEQIINDVTGDIGNLLREDRESCWQKWREANQALYYKRQSISENNYRQIKSKAYEALSAASDGDPREALSKVKETQIELKDVYIDRVQRGEIRQLLNESWNKATYRLNLVREEKRRKYEEWRSRAENNIERWSELLRKNEGIV